MVTLKCKICGKEFKVIPSRKYTAKYCSKDCAVIALRGSLNCKCEICGKKFHRKESRILKNKHQVCSRECLRELKKILFTGKGNHQYGLKGDLNSSFKGIEIKRKNNNLIEIKVYKPNHPFADKNSRVCKHRLIVEEYYNLFNPTYFIEINGNFYLKPGIEVHHINHDHTDNRIENLIPVTKSEHRIIHNSFQTIVRDKLGKITGVLKQGELLEKPEEVDQQPSQPLTKLEGSETNS